MTLRDEIMCVLGGQGAGAHAVVGVWSSEDKLRCQSAPSTLFEAGSLVHCCVHQAGWATNFKGFSYVHLASAQRAHNRVQLARGSDDLNWVCKLIQEAFNPPIRLSGPSLFLNWLLRLQFSHGFHCGIFLHMYRVLLPAN